MESETENSLDNLNVLTFRIKTKEEFIAEFGKNWESRVECGWNPGMDTYFGYIIPKEHNLKCFKLMLGVVVAERFRVINGDYTWSFSKDMLIWKYDDVTS